MTIALLTSRPSVVMASRSNERPAPGSPAGDSTTTSRPSDVPGSRAAARRSRSERADDARQEEVEQGQEQEPDDPDDEHEAVHQSGAVPSDLDHDHGVAELDPVAGAEHELADRHAVDPRAVGAAEVRVDERPAPAR